MTSKVKKIKDLEDIFYGLNVSKIRAYEDGVKTKFLSPAIESEVKQLFSPIGEVEKRSRGKNKTDDFIIKEEKLLIEVTSLNTVVLGSKVEAGNMPINLPANENKFLERINRTIAHGVEKKGLEGYSKIVVVGYDEVLAGLKEDLIKKLYAVEFIRRTSFPTSSLDALVFLPPKVGETPKPFGYAKNERIVTLLKKLDGLEVEQL